MTTSVINDREIVTIRTVDASCGTVFNAWATPGQLARWWGPKGFTNTFHQFDFRKEGEWKFTMHAPDGKTDYPNHCVFEKIDAPHTIVFRHLQAAHSFTVTVTLEEAGSKTRLTFRMTFDDPADCARSKDVILQANEENVDRLDALLASF